MLGGNEMVRITIETGSTAFDRDPGNELARILQGIAASATLHGLGALDGRALIDQNGNTVGTVQVELRN